MLFDKNKLRLPDAEDALDRLVDVAKDDVRICGVIVTSWRTLPSRARVTVISGRSSPEARR